MLENAAEYLVPVDVAGQGTGYKAKKAIPAGTRMTAYSGRISRFHADAGDHYLTLDEGSLGYPLIVDGTPPAHTTSASVPVGQMQMLNHACPPNANCRSDELICEDSLLPLSFVYAIRDIPEGEEIRFSYQLRVTASSFWRLEGTLGKPPRGSKLQHCLCAKPLACPNRYARHERHPSAQPPAAAPHLPPPTTLIPPQPHLATTPTLIPQHPPPPAPPLQPPIYSPSTPTHLTALPPPSLSRPPLPPFSRITLPTRHATPHPPPHAHTHMLSLNLGQHGIRAALPSLVRHFESRPGVVMFQECHCPQSALGELRRTAHTLLPAYCVFACRPDKSARRDTQIQVITLVHMQLAARACLLDVGQQLAAVAREAPDARSRTHFIRVIDPLSEVSLLLVNAYQYQAGQPEQQAALLSLISKVAERWGGQSEHVIIGGDWNASLGPRVGYSGHARVARADARLQAWSDSASFTCEAPAEHTWNSADDSRRAVLDCFFWKSKSGQPSISHAEAFLAADPTLDHCGVKVLLLDPNIREMPPLEALWRPERLRLDAWRDKREEWQRAVERDLSSQELIGSKDRFAALDRAKCVALLCARAILGVTGGKLRSVIPHHSSEWKQLQARLRLLKVVRRELYARQGQAARAPSRAMRKVWDAGWHPQPASFLLLAEPWAPQHRDWTEGWLRQLRQRSHDAREALIALRTEAVKEAERQSQRLAIARFYDGRGLQRLLRPQAPSLHSPLLESGIPDTLVVHGPTASLDRLVDGLRGIGQGASIAWSTGRVKVTNVIPSAWHGVLTLCKGTDLTIDCLSGEGGVVSTVGDRLCSWEHALASEAAAKKGVCPGCLCTSDFLFPVSAERDGTRSVETWCLKCKQTVQPVVDALEYDWLAFLPAGFEAPSVPLDTEATLRGPISPDDFDFFIGQLPNKKAADGLPYELWKGAPALLKQALLDCINAILERKANPPPSWLGGVIRFLFKKGNLQKIGNYRPVCLQDTAYKMLSAILTDRLYRLAERYGLLDASQEGFRKLHSTQRQVQSLHWAFESAAQRRKPLYCCYLDFRNAFNSIDHEALWRWLRKLNIPDIDLLQALYERACYEADLPYGRSAPIFLTRGQKQGDKLSPLLFNLIFNALLLALKATGIGHRTVTGLRAPAHGFADDLTLITESEEDMSRLLGVVADFCAWSGMRIKREKSVMTAYDFNNKRELPTDTILFEGQALVRLAADESFPYLGVRASLIQRKRRGTTSPGLMSEKSHIFSATKELVGIAKGHKFLLGQMVPAMHMVATSRFRYSAPLVLWTDAELNELHRVWLQVHRAAWRLPPGYPSAPLTLPSAHGGSPVSHPRVLLVQALAKHIEQLVALPDDLRQDTIARYRKLCSACGCHNARELAEHLAEERSPRSCPIARFLRACGQLGIEARLPVCLSTGKLQRETSWHSLLVHLRRQTSASGADEGLKLDMTHVNLAWTAIRRCLARRGIRQPRQLVLDPRAHPPVWLLPASLRGQARALDPLRRVLLVADASALFPPLNRGEGVPVVPVHQALLHDVLAGLSRPDANVIELFTDGRWNNVISTAPLTAWLSTMRAHGLVSLADSSHVASRRTAPIADIVALGHCPAISADCLRSLCLALAPHLGSATAPRADVDVSPLTWEPVRLAVDRVEFAWLDDTAGTETLGQYTATTRDGLTRIQEGDKHVATVSQGRWGLLKSAYDARDVCAALPAWAAQVDKEETSKGVASAQFWHGVRAVLDAECVVGCNPLVAPSSFPVAIRSWGTLEGWGHPWAAPPSRVMYCLLTQSPEEQRLLVRPLAADGIWWALTRRSTLDLEVKDMLRQRGGVVTVYKRGTRATATKGSWRAAILRATKTREDWTLWASLGAAASAPPHADLKRRLDSIRLTEDGVVPLDLSCPSAREAALGPAGPAYQHQGITVGTDGSLKSNGAMGAAFVAKDGRMPARSVAVYGSPSSLRPELTAVALACEDSPLDQDLTILTDSLTGMRLLKSLQRRDFPLWLYRHPERQLLIYVASLVNKRAASNVITRFVKVKAHRSEPLNEAADALASDAAELDPSRPLDLDPEAVYFYFKDSPIEWDARLREHLTQVAASLSMALIGKPTRRRDGTVTPAHVPLSAAWLLRPDQGRSTLGAALHSIRISASKRRTLQALAGVFPCNAILHKWRIAASPACTLCGHAAETLSHIQCVCPALKEARIRAHHNLVMMLWGRLENASSRWKIYREMTVDALHGLEAPLDCQDEWQRAVDELVELDLETGDDLAAAAGLLRKRPDGFAFNWSSKTVLILEFTRAYDWRDTWHTDMDRLKTERYVPLRDKLSHSLPSGWNVAIVTFSLGVRGSYDVQTWQAALQRFNLNGDNAEELMTELVTQCLAEADELFNVRTAALKTANAPAH